MAETFTRKIGPLPMWAWTAIVGAVIVGWAWWKNRQSGSSSSTTSSTANASQVPEFVNQTYTSVQPPSAPDNDTSREEPPGVSRVGRAPKVKHQINQIHKEHQDYEQDKRPSRKPSGDVHKTTPQRGGPVRRRG